MSKIRLFGDTSGYVDITAPAVADNSALSIGDIATESYVDARTPPGAWTAYTPSVSSGSGSITTLSTSGRYIQIGKIVIVRGSVAITNAGTGAAGLFVTVPVTAQSGGPAGSAAETNATGWACSCWLNNTTQLHIYRYDGSTIIANNRTVNFSITYEAA